MKGKQVFSSRQASLIRALIQQKLVVDSQTQKSIRAKIRAEGFYISDFTNKKKYAVEDFDRYSTVLE